MSAPSVATADVSAVVQRVIARIAPDGAGEVASEAGLVQDLGFESLTTVELGFALQDLFGISVDPKDVLDIKTVADVADIVIRQLRAGTGHMPSAAGLDEWLAGYSDEGS